MTTIEDFPYDASRKVRQLVAVLRTLHDKDPEQEVRGIAVPVLDACLEEIRATVPNDPTLAAVATALEYELHTGEPVRVADALIVAELMAAALGDPPPVIA